MGFHTGKHGKVYNDDKKSKGSKSNNPGNKDGSNEHVKDYDNNKAYDDAEAEMKEYFNSFHWDFIKTQFTNPDKSIKSPDVDEVLLSEFDDEEVEYSGGDKKIKVMYIGEQQNIFADQLEGTSDEAKDEVFSDYMFGKGDDIVRKQLGDDYTWYIREQDVFIVKGL